MKKPLSSVRDDDLGFCEAFLNRSNNTLILITPQAWTLLDLKPVMATNARIELSPKPRKGNFLYWSSFKPGRPAPKLLAGTEKVAIATDQYATFGYKRNDTLWQDHNNPAVIPAGYSSALFCSSGGYAKNNKDWFKSYSLATSAKKPNEVRGVEFFLNPGKRIVLLKYWWIGLINPGFIALCIAVPVAFGRARAMASTMLFLVAFLLHGFAFLVYRWMVSSGEAWSGGGALHNAPMYYFVIGCFILFLLIAIKVVRSRLSEPSKYL